MANEMKSKLISIMQEKQRNDDPSHDYQHILRVVNLAEQIAKVEGGDLDVIIPAALFHDIIVYPKNTKESKNAPEESANFVGQVLNHLDNFPKEKISFVKTCITECSFSKGKQPSLLESKILQDADRLEATGAISIMRTFSSGGQMNRPFYNPKDPFCETTTDDLKFSLDLFYSRLLVVQNGMHTTTAKNIARGRTKFLLTFLDQLKTELRESNIYS